MWQGKTTAAPNADLDAALWHAEAVAHQALRYAT